MRGCPKPPPQPFGLAWRRLAVGCVVGGARRTRPRALPRGVCPADFPMRNGLYFLWWAEAVWWWRCGGGVGEGGGQGGRARRDPQERWDMHLSQPPPPLPPTTTCLGWYWGPRASPRSRISFEPCMARDLQGGAVHPHAAVGSPRKPSTPQARVSLAAAPACLSRGPNQRCRPQHPLPA
jgi:hypothetical protein